AGLRDARGCAVYGFQQQTVCCTVVAGWEVGHQAGWLVLTALPPAGAQVACYGVRARVEAGFKASRTAKARGGSGRSPACPIRHARRVSGWCWRWPPAGRSASAARPPARWRGSGPLSTPPTSAQLLPSGGLILGIGAAAREPAPTARFIP